jgi:hypothetical protein
MVAVIVATDVLFFKNRFWERLTVNIGIVLVFAAFYFRFLKPPWFGGWFPNRKWHDAAWQIHWSECGRARLAIREHWAAPHRSLFALAERYAMKRKRHILLGAAVAAGAIGAPLITWLAFKPVKAGQTYWVDARGAQIVVSVVGDDGIPHRAGMPPSPSFLWYSFRPDWPSRAEIAQVRHAVRDDLWHRVFPSVSWRTLQEAPHALRLLASCRIEEVTLNPGEMVQVRLRSCFGECFCLLQKGKPLRFLRGPTTPVARAGFASPAEPKQRRALTEATFAESLSNHATLTFGHWFG